MDLTTATPVEIDTVLADLYDQSVTLRQASTRAAEWVMSGANMRHADAKPRYRDDRVVGTLAEAKVIVQAQADSGRYDAASAQRLLDNLAEAKAALAANTEAQAPLHAEYGRRPWTRAYLVLSSNGHVHSSMDCSTCFYPRYDDRSGEYKPGTQFGWLPSLSGHDEAEIVDASGADACTVCYPTAPVVSLSRPRRVLHHTEVAAQAARDERAAKKAAAAAKKAEKAITNPDGTPLEVFDYHVAERHMQQRDGSVVVKPAYDRTEVLETAHAAKAFLTDAHGYYGGKRATDIAMVAEALAVKFGTTPEDEILAAKKRAAKR